MSGKFRPFIFLLQKSCKILVLWPFRAHKEWSLLHKNQTEITIDWCCKIINPTCPYFLRKFSKKVRRGVLLNHLHVAAGFFPFS